MFCAECGRGGGCDIGDVEEPADRVKHLLKVAIEKRDLRKVRLMIESGQIDVNARGIDRVSGGCGSTAVIEAAYNRDLDIVKYLISRGADLTIGTEDENATVFDYATGEVLAFLQDEDALAACRAEGAAAMAVEAEEKRSNERADAQPFVDAAMAAAQQECGDLRQALESAHERIQELEKQLSTAQGSIKELETALALAHGAQISQ
uniref:Uncharacterized protein n=1 Tax=Chromera velia CCMP2878 TaxID=1169474 RepID=A0A0G4ICK1_9ALVE|mmetsp:Transcript_52898/g.103442  ORF Transcript_52898/g.103442 Transcript_52898/m.103442 type:complete len:206 (+) Transcript_52898:306-923(+)|eukprot:Cvel_2275.t1-p1 / transcript=Cvel_2275.t1 / gene=Cvel_2275 / organism=Chromera_velia_CCMP2878 / gene_product=Histone-lysine N-methyltransferase EHMT2, putative / transcript_product=Histone-lysine N-methyltransferase EHMT2, putative / location=Cvel_scaffold88:45499-46113(+) / protein_length=205 / sequence_SO=supercontig / SO=protein_coding / is_pseudo=false